MNDKIPARALRLIALIAALLLAGWHFGIFEKKPRRRSVEASPTHESASPASRENAPPPELEDPSPAGMIARLFERLRTGNFTAQDLATFRASLLAANPAEAIAAINAFLATGQDATTGERFAVGPGGELAGAPTARTLLLDLLGRIARKTGSGEAAITSRALLERQTSADEWAVALRNVAWASPGERQYLGGKMREMLGNQTWRRQPSAGFIEAFDIIVFVRDATFIPEFDSMVRSEDKALQRAAAVAMDRLGELAPLDVMNWLNTNPGEFSAKPLLRADYFSKADFTQPAQRLAVETYLARSDATAGEKSKLIAVLAAPGTFASDNLVTPPPPEEIPPAREAALRQTVGDWLKTNRFPELLPSLLKLQARLGETADPQR